MWAQAEQMKAAAVLKSREESSIDMERTIKKINRQHEKALKVFIRIWRTKHEYAFIMHGYSYCVCDKKIFTINSNMLHVFMLLLL